LLLTLAIAWGSLAAVLSAGWTPKLGLDLQGGFSVVLTAPEGTDTQVLDKAVEIMRNRIATLGSVQEPEISVQGSRSILVQLQHRRLRAGEVQVVHPALQPRHHLGGQGRLAYARDAVDDHDPGRGRGDVVVERLQLLDAPHELPGLGLANPQCRSSAEAPAE